LETKILLQEDPRPALVVRLDPPREPIAAPVLRQAARQADDKPLPNLLHTLEGHEDAVLCVAFSPDNKRAVSGSADKTVRVWDVKTGKELACYKGHTGEVLHVAFTPDGNRVLSAGADKTLRLWVEDEKKEPQTFEGHTDKITGIAVSADGSLLISSSLDKTVRVWDLETRKELHCLKGHTLGVLGVAIAADGQLVASAGQDKTVRLWDAKTGKEVGRYDDHKGWVYCVALASPGGGYMEVLSGGADGLVQVKTVTFGVVMGKDGPEYDRTFFQSGEKHDGRTGSIYAVAFFRDVGRFVTGSDDKTVRIWSCDPKKLMDGQTTTGGFPSPIKEFKRYAPHTEPVRSVAVSPDGLKILSGSEDKTVRLWEVPEK
jgi:WD40 repeat protein